MTYVVDEFGLKIVRSVRMVYTQFNPRKRKPLPSNSKDLFEFLLAHWNTPTLTRKLDCQETWKILFLNRHSRPLGLYDLSREAMLRIKESPISLLFCAPEAPIRSMVIAYNPPTGFLSPEIADYQLVCKFLQFGAQNKITLLDYLILNSGGYCSFRDQGIL